MPQNPAFSLNGAPVFDNTSVSFQVVFENPGDANIVQAYEWYLDGILITQAESDAFAKQIACGSHVIGVRLLSNNAWTGTQELSFETCKTVSSSYISGPDTVIVGQSEAYTVIWVFTDGTTADMTAQYTFAASAGGSFTGNIFTATGDGSDNPSITVTITASSASASPLTKDITVTVPDITAAGILVVDLFNNSALNVIGLVDNTEVAYSHVAAHTGVNIIPAGSLPANALIVASDFINQSVLNWRFLFNLAKLKTEYPATANFVFYIKGRSNVAGTITGAYNLKNEATTMILEGTPGTYLPSTAGGNQLGSPVNFTGPVVSGANGSFNEAYLTTIIKLTFNVADNSITYTNA